MRMELTTQLAQDLFQIQELSVRDKKQLQTLIIDFFAAAYAGYRQNRAFNEKVEAVVYPQGGTEESSILFQRKRYPARIAAFMNSV